MYQMEGLPVMKALGKYNLLSEGKCLLSNMNSAVVSHSPPVSLPFLFPHRGSPKYMGLPLRH
jgi:hypothetical protein